MVPPLSIFDTIDKGAYGHFDLYQLFVTGDAVSLVSDQVIQITQSSQHLYYVCY